MDRMNQLLPALPRGVSLQLTPHSPKVSDSATRVTALTVILTAIRVAKGLPAEESEEVEFTARLWDKILGAIPTESLNDAFIRAMMNWDDKREPFGTPQMIAAWREIEKERLEDSGPKLAPEACYFCNGSGWQSTDRGARPCACDNAPAGSRSAEFLCEPHWSLNPVGCWVKVGAK